MTAPVRAGNGRERRRHSDPSACRVVSRRPCVALRRRMLEPAVASLSALPVELHFDSVVAVSMYVRSTRAHNNGALLTLDDRARMQQLPARPSNCCDTRRC